MVGILEGAGSYSDLCFKEIGDAVLGRLTCQLFSTRSLPEGEVDLIFGSLIVLPGDITAIEASQIPLHDVLTAGFPCQSFSRAGEEGGLGDPRGELFFEVVRVLEERQPKAFLLENVAHLQRLQQGAVLRTILAELRSAGYTVEYRVMNTRAVLPQQRERLYFVGFRRDLLEAARCFEWPTLPFIPLLVRHILEPMRPPGVGLDRAGVAGAPVSTREEDAGGAVEASGAAGATREEMSGRESDVSTAEPIDAYMLSDHQWEVIRGRREFVTNPESRLANLEGAARTLMSSYRRGYSQLSEFVPVEGDSDGNGERHAGGSGKPRFYTPRECARLQGFPEAFQLEGVLPSPNRLYHQLGNSASPVMVAAIGACVTRALRQVPPESHHRGDVAAALELLTDAVRDPNLPLGAEGLSLMKRVATFVQQGKGNPCGIEAQGEASLCGALAEGDGSALTRELQLEYGGRGASVTQCDLQRLKDQLRHSNMCEVVVSALNTVARLADGEVSGVATAKQNSDSIIEFDLVPSMLDAYHRICRRPAERKRAIVRAISRVLVLAFSKLASDPLHAHVLGQYTEVCSTLEELARDASDPHLRQHAERTWRCIAIA
eukprot:gene6477-7766_t